MIVRGAKYIFLIPTGIPAAGIKTLKSHTVPP